MSTLNKVGYLRTNKTPIRSRVCRSVFANGDDEDWSGIIGDAIDKGILPADLYMKDLVGFNERGSKFQGTVKEFLDHELRAKRPKKRRGK